MPGRHDSRSGDPDRWAPTALHAAAACTPVGSVLAALGLAGGGYLTGREDVAACGAVVGAFGLVAERLSSRRLRVRLRRERVRFRDDLRGIGRDLGDVQRRLAGLRDDLEAVRSERDDVRAQLRATVQDLDHARRSVLSPAPAAVPGPIAVPEPVLPAGVPGPVALWPADVPAAPATPPAPAPAPAPVRTPAPARLGFLVPGQVRSPIATGGIPVLPPGPSRPVRVIDLRAAEPSAPAPTLPASTVDALVWAAMADADADDLTRLLEDPAHRGGRHAGSLHTGDAHHAGDYARDDAATGATPALFVVHRGRHAA